MSADRDDCDVLVQLIVLVQDLTYQRAAEEAQRRSQALIDAAVAALPVTLTTFDRSLRFTSVAGGLDQVGNQPEDFLGKHISEVTEDPHTLLALQNALAGTELMTRTLVSGQTYLTLHGPMKDGDGAVVGVVAVTSNVTVEVAAEAERRRAEQEALFLARHDPLTGLPGRSALIEYLTAPAPAGGAPGALLLLDLDDFTIINEGLGYRVGDAVLLEVASRLLDAFPGAMVARHGGDEFAIVTATVGDLAGAEELAQRVRAVLEPDVDVVGHTLRVTASFGIALHQARASRSTLIGNADAALSRAKEAGADQHRVYDVEMRHRMESRLRIQGGLRVALATQQLRVAYQPIVALGDRHIAGAEALLRWTHPEWGVVAPAEFIPIAEQTGLILPIGRWVMQTACADMLALHRTHGIYVSVNVSARQLVGGGFAEWVEETLELTGLPPTALVIEVTESALMDDIAVTRAAFDSLRSRGVQVGIDDFGTGYSSLARLLRLPVDVIKLDRAFVTDIDARAEARGMAAAVLQLSAAIGAETVAEGVETEAEAATLRDLGYTRGQGFLFAAADCVDNLTARLRAARPTSVSAEDGEGDANARSA